MRRPLTTMELQVFLDQLHTFAPHYDWRVDYEGRFRGRPVASPRNLYVCPILAVAMCTVYAGEGLSPNADAFFVGEQMELSRESAILIMDSADNIAGEEPDIFRTALFHAVGWPTPQGGV